MILRELINQFGFKIDDKALEAAEKKVSGFTKKLDNLGRAATKTGKGLSLKLTLPILGVGAALIKAASDAEETETKFNTVFESIQEESNRTAKQLSKDFGLSSTKAKELLGNTGDLLTGFGFTEDAALKLSTDVQKLAVDLASFTNFSGGAAGASAALTKALLGERESVKSLGISILEEDVKKQVQLNRTNGLVFATERQAKAQATLDIALRQSKKAVGDFARTNQGFANQMRILGGETNDLAVSFGKLLLPLALKLVKGVRFLVNVFEDFSDETKTIILVVGGLLAALGPALIIFGSIASGAAALIPLIIKLGLGLRSLGNISLIAQVKLLAIPLAIGAVIAAIVLLAEDFKAFSEGRDSVIGRLFIGLDSAFTSLSAKFEAFGDVAKTVVAVILTPFRALLSIVKNVGAAISLLTGKSSFKEFLSSVGENASSVFNIAKASRSLGGALGLGDGASPIGALASKAREAQGGGTNITQTGELNVNVTGLPPEQAKEAAEGAMATAFAQVLRRTTRSARPVVER